MKKLFDRASCASSDYTPSMLPQTRTAVFFDVLKLNWKKFMLYGLLFLLFSLPMEMVAVSEGMAVINLQRAEIDMAPQQIPYMIAMTKIIASVIKLPCLLLIAVAVSGFARVIRQYAWMENVYFTYEFKKGIKSNLGQMLVLALTAGAVNVLITVFIAVAETAAEFFTSVFLLIPAAFLILYLLPVFAYMAVSISIYGNSYGNHYKVGRVVYSRMLWKTLLALVCCGAPFALQKIPSFLSQFVGAVLSPMLTPVVFLGWYLFALNQFDESINRVHYPQLVGRGIRN